MRDDHKDILGVMRRVVTLRCPVCGRASIVERPFNIKHHCTNCRALFKREDGFFVGAILVGVVTTELTILIVCFFWLVVIGSDYDKVLIGLFAVAVIFPLAFYHHSWSIWLGFDHLVETLPIYPARGPGQRFP